MEFKKIIKGEDGQDLVYCAKERDYLPSSEFGTYSMTGKYRSYCRKCEAFRERSRKGGGMTKRTKSDMEYAKDILDSMGYVMDSDVPLWVQFLMRHDMLERSLDENPSSLKKPHRS